MKTILPNRQAAPASLQRFSPCNRALTVNVEL